MSFFMKIVKLKCGVKGLLNLVVDMLVSLNAFVLI